MELTVHIPDDIAARLASAGGDLSRHAMEGLALEEYKNGHITDPELLLLLGFETRYELDGFLKTMESSKISSTTLPTCAARDSERCGRN